MSCVSLNMHENSLWAGLGMNMVDLHLGQTLFWAYSFCMNQRQREGRDYQNCLEIVLLLGYLYTGHANMNMNIEFGSDCQCGVANKV